MTKVIPIIFLILHAATASVAADDAIPVGVSVSLTGAGSSWGNDVRDAIEYAARRFGAGKYRLIFEDDKCSAKEGALIAQKFASQDRVKYVLGYNCSSSLLAAVPIFATKNVVVISSGATARSDGVGRHVVRTWPRDDLAAALLGEWAVQRYKTIAVLSEEADYSRQFENAFMTAVQARGGSVSADSFLPGTNDFRSLLLRLVKGRAEAILINPVSESAFLAVLKQLRGIDARAPVLGAFFPGSSSFQKIAGVLSDGLVFVDAPNSEEIVTNVGAQILSDYHRQFGPARSWEFMVGSAIEAFRTLDRLAGQPKGAGEYLLNGEFQGVYGKYSFGPDGYVRGIRHSLYRYEAGRRSPLQSN